MTDGLKEWLRRGAAGLMVAVLACVLGGCSFGTPPLSEVEEETPEQAIDDALLVQPGTLTVALDTGDLPQVMTDEDGYYVGYTIDVASELADSLGLKLAIVHSVSPQDAIESGEADIYLGATARDQTDGIVVLGEYLQNATAIFGIGGSSSEALTADDLAQATIGVQGGKASQEALARIGIATDSTYDTVNDCFDALAAGEVDYVACDATAGAYLARTYEGAYFAGTISASTSYGIAYDSSATELSDAVGAALDEMSGDGTLDAIHVMWYGDLPLNLSSELISGVTITEESGSSDEDTESGEEDHSDINDY